MVGAHMALYARVSTRDKDQDPELQLRPLREYALAQRWRFVEYVDWASGADLKQRAAWARLTAAIERGEVVCVVTWKLDRALSMLDALATLQDWTRRGVRFRCLTQADVDLGSPTGRLVFTILAAVAEMERSLISDRVREGMVLATRNGAAIGRPPVTSRKTVQRRWPRLRPRVIDGPLGRDEAAALLGIGRSTLNRLLASDWQPNS